MTETATIYYHRPKLKKTTVRTEVQEETGFDILRMGAELASDGSRDRVPAAERTAHAVKAPVALEYNVPRDSVFNCTVNTLRSLGLTGKYDGFIYICRAVEAILSDREAPHFQSIYYDIGKEYDVNRCSVERSIRYAIGYIRRTGNFSKISAIFGEAVTDDKNFSNSKFLTILAADVYEKLTSLEMDV